MSRFLTPLRTLLVVDPSGTPQLTRSGRQLFQLLSDFSYQSDVAGLITVPAGFITDFCSQPDITMALFGECAQEPSVPHDYAYTTHCITKEVADKMLYEACILTGIPKWKASLIYAGVRVGGASHWNPDKTA